MRCPECREGIMYKCKAKMKNGAFATVLVCDEVDDAWVDEVCLETEIDFHDVLEVAESYGEVDSDHSRDNIIPSEIYYGWDKIECTDIWCPYCRTEKLEHGITAQTKREITRCPRCLAIWIGSISPDNISNYRKYMADGIRLPDETEIDSFGEKYPAIFDKVQDTEYVCPKCGDGILYGTIRASGKKAHYCNRCRSVWYNPDRLPQKQK